VKSHLKPCKACGQPIAKAAATCPHCGKTTTSLARIGLLFVCVLLIMAISWMAF
jgi:RNA polymerase subunit RPABC4/transcription elongation factor Spt4